MIHPCDKLCGNKTASGYCATTVCINPQYSNIGTAQYVQGVQKRTVTNYDRLISKTPEELAQWLVLVEQRILEMQPMLERPALYKDWIDYLRQEAES